MVNRFDVERLPFLGTISRPSFGTRRSRVWIAVSSLLIVCVLFLGILSPSQHLSNGRAKAKAIWKQITNHDTKTYLRVASQPGSVIQAPDRAIDLLDSFQNFTRTPNCSFSSLDLHDPFAPLCQDRDSLMTAMSSGGRAGVDAPYSPRDCDMRWFTKVEICDILSRFDEILLIGDSMMRNLAVAMHTLLREDLVNGPRLSWRSDPPGLDCRCQTAFGDRACIWNTAFSSKLIRAEKPEVIVCPEGNTAFVEFNTELEYPLGEGVPQLAGVLPKTRPAKPTVFVLGNGLWNDLNEAATQRWIAQIEAAIVDNMPWLKGGVIANHLLDIDEGGGDTHGQDGGIETAPDESVWPGSDDVNQTGDDEDSTTPKRARRQRRSTFQVAGASSHKGTGNNGDPSFPRLFITPTASGRNKPKQFVESQGHIALQRFETNLGPWVKKQGYDHLGLYNLTIQNSSPDGTHAGMRANIVKAMMVLNWLNTIDVSDW